MTGEVAALGSNYVVTLGALDCVTGESLAAQQVEAAAKEEVLAALGKAVSEMRRDLGESLASVERYDAPIERATTSSLEALQAYSRAVEQRNFEGDLAATPFFERAIELDPNFALAHGRLGSAYSNQGRLDKAHEHWGKAYELSDRVSEPERLYIHAHYFDDLLGDQRKGVEVYQQWIATYPRHWTPHSNLANDYRGLGQYEKSLEAALEAVRLEPDHSFPQANLAFTYFSLGQLDETRAVMETMKAKGIGGGNLDFLQSMFAAHAGDEAALREAGRPAEGTPGEPFVLTQLASYLIRKGRLSEARATAGRAVEKANSLGAGETASFAMLSLASALADFGYVDEAAELARRALESSRDQQTLAGVAVLMGELGVASESDAVVAELVERWPQNTIVQEVIVPSTDALRALLDGDAPAAVDRLEVARPYERAYLNVLKIRGQAYLASNQPEKAVLTFEQLDSLDTVFPSWYIHDIARLWVARAHLANGDAEAARTAYQDFFALMKDADEGIPLIEKARGEYETIPGVKG